MAGTQRTVTIAVDETESTAINLGDSSLGLVVMPSGLTAATLALHGSFDGTTFWPLFETDGTAITFTKPGTLPGAAPADPVWTFTTQYVKLVGNTAQLTSDAAITLGIAPVT